MFEPALAYCEDVVVCDVVELVVGVGAICVEELCSDDVVEVVVVEASLAQPASNPHTLSAADARSR